MRLIKKEVTLMVSLPYDKKYADLSGNYIIAYFLVKKRTLTRKSALVETTHGRNLIVLATRAIKCFTHFKFLFFAVVPTLYRP